MEESQFKRLIKKDKYQVFLFSCNVSIPGTIGVHYWFVLNKKGKIRRWEVLFRKSFPGEKKWDHLFLNSLPPTSGTEILLYLDRFRWKSNFEKKIEGDKNSLAKKMIDFIESSPKLYPYKNKYHFVPGPNSNTYIQWILNEFPEFKFKLSWRAIGKGYKLPNSKKENE